MTLEEPLQNVTTKLSICTDGIAFMAKPWSVDDVIVHLYKNKTFTKSTHFTLLAEEPTIRADKSHYILITTTTKQVSHKRTWQRSEIPNSNHWNKLLTLFKYHTMTSSKFTEAVILVVASAVSIARGKGLTGIWQNMTHTTLMIHRRTLPPPVTHLRWTQKSRISCWHVNLSNRYTEIALLEP